MHYEVETFHFMDILMPLALQKSKGTTLDKVSTSVTLLENKNRA